MTTTTKQTTVFEVKARLEAIVASMLAKGFERPDAQFWIKANFTNTVYLTATENVPNFYGEDLQPLIDAELWVAAKPTLAERRHGEFLNALAEAKRLGVIAGVEDEQLNVLDAIAKKLASNVLAAPIESRAHLDALLDGDNIPF